MTDSTATRTLSYRSLLTDSSLLAVLFISGVAAFGYNAVPVALPGIGAAFGLTEAQIGLVMSTFSIAVLVMLPITSILADLYGRRAVVIPSLALFGLSGMATFWVSSYEVLLALRVVQGIGFAGTLPLTATLAGDLYTGVEGSTAQGLRSGVNGFMSAAAPVVAGLLTVVAWQYPFVLFALSLPVAVLVYVYYPEPVETQRETDVGFLSALRRYWLSIWNAADRTLALLVAGGFTLFFVKAGFQTFIPVFVVAGLGASVAAAGTVLGVYGGTRVIVSPLSGSVMLRLGRKYTMLLGTALAAVGMAAVPFAPSLPLLGVAAAIYASGEAILNPVVNDAVAAFAADDQRAGMMSGHQVFKNAALTLSPIVMGTLIGASGFRGAFLLGAALAVGYALVLVVRFDPGENTFDG